MQEWFLWTGLITFSLLIIESLFVFDYFLVLLTQIIGLGTMVWIRFIRFPPVLRAHEQRLARERYFTKQKFARRSRTTARRTAAAAPAGAVAEAKAASRVDAKISQEPQTCGRHELSSSNALCVCLRIFAIRN